MWHFTSLWKLTQILATGRIEPKFSESWGDSERVGTSTPTIFALEGGELPPEGALGCARCNSAPRKYSRRWTGEILVGFNPTNG